MPKWSKALLWLGVSLLGALALGTVALHRGENINAMWLVVAAVCSYAIGYRFYSKFIAARVMVLDYNRATPAERLDDGHDFVPTNKWIVFGHHFAAIAGPGPLVGPVLAAQFGYLPGTLWIIAGAVFGGCVQDFVILLCFDAAGRQIAWPRWRAKRLAGSADSSRYVTVIMIMVILLGAVALVVVNALKAARGEPSPSRRRCLSRSSWDSISATGGPARCWNALQSASCWSCRDLSADSGSRRILQLAPVFTLTA